ERILVHVERDADDLEIRRLSMMTPVLLRDLEIDRAPEGRDRLEVQDVDMDQPLLKWPKGQDRAGDDRIIDREVAEHEADRERDEDPGDQDLRASHLEEGGRGVFERH